MDADAAQDRGGGRGGVLVRRVGESHVGELDVARGQRLGVGRVGNDGRAVGDRKDAGRRREGLIQVGSELLNREDRAEGTHGDAEGESRLGQRQRVGEHVRARDHGDRDDAEGDGCLVEASAQRDPAALGAHPCGDTLFDGAHLGLAALLRPKGEDLAHALHRVGHVGGDRAAGLAQLTRRTRGGAGAQEGNNRTDDQQEGRQHGCKRPGHGAAHPHDRQDRDDDGRRDGGERVGKEDLDAVDILRHAVHDVARIQAIRARGSLGLELVVEVVAQHRQGVEGHEVTGELLEVAGQALEQAQADGANNDEGDAPGALPRREAGDGPAAQGKQGDADHEEDDAGGDGGRERRQDAPRDRQESKRQLPAGHRIVPSCRVATRSAPLMVASR